MVNDPIGDMLIQIKNASMARIKYITLPFSRLRFEVATIIYEAGYISSVEKLGDVPKKQIRIAIKYEGKEPYLTDLKRKSKPGLRVYVNKHNIPTVIGGMGICILSTSKGIMTGKEAKKLGLGGELLCEIW